MEVIRLKGGTLRQVSSGGKRERACQSREAHFGLYCSPLVLQRVSDPAEGWSLSRPSPAQAGRSASLLPLLASMAPTGNTEE